MYTHQKITYPVDQPKLLVSPRIITAAEVSRGTSGTPF